MTSLIEAMFAPRPELVARELLRLCSAGRTIALGNWTRKGIGQMFKTFAKFIAPSGLPAPVLWGDDPPVAPSNRWMKLTRDNSVMNSQHCGLRIIARATS